MLPVLGLRDGPGPGDAFGGEGAFHLGEQRQEQERDAAHALVGGIDRQRVGQLSGRGRSGVTGPTATFPKCAANPGARSAHTV